MAVLVLSLMFMIHTVWQAMPATPHDGSAYGDECYNAGLGGERAEIAPIFGGGGAAEAEEVLQGMGVPRTIPCEGAVAGDALE